MEINRRNFMKKAAIAGITTAALSTSVLPDAVAWSAISALSEMSISRGNIPVDFPDFTRGQWIKFKDEKVFAPDDMFPVLSDRFIKF